MTNAANDGAYGNNPSWGPGPNANRWTWGQSWNRNWGPPGGPPPWGPGHPFGHPFFMAKPVLIVLMILGFIFWWPIGLALLLFGIWGSRWARGFHCRSAGTGPNDGPLHAWKNWWSGDRSPPSSGNRAFDEYRAETLRRLEEEQKEFGEFLDRLRFAKDKAEFDQFMNERRNRPAESPPEQGHPA